MRWILAQGQHLRKHYFQCQKMDWLEFEKCCNVSFGFIFQLKADGKNCIRAERDHQLCKNTVQLRTRIVFTYLVESSDFLQAQKRHSGSTMSRYFPKFSKNVASVCSFLKTLFVDLLSYLNKTRSNLRQPPKQISLAQSRFASTKRNSRLAIFSLCLLFPLFYCFVSQFLDECFFRAILGSRIRGNAIKREVFGLLKSEFVLFGLARSFYIYMCNFMIHWKCT